MTISTERTSTGDYLTKEGMFLGMGMYKTGVDLRTLRHLGATWPRRILMSVGRIVGLRNCTTGEQSVTPLAYHVVWLEEMLSGLRRSLPPVNTSVVNIGGGRTSISAWALRPNALVLSLLYLN